MTTSFTQIGPYRGRRVAAGGFADIYYVPESCHGTAVALKWAHSCPGSCGNDALVHEFSVLNEFEHSRLPRALDFGWAKDRPYLVLDWIRGEPLCKSGTAAAKPTLVETLREIARVLVFIHHRGWVHSDLKPDNFLWGAPRAMATALSGESQSAPLLHLIDFGLARKVGDRGRPRGAGTVGYTAPEFLRKEPADGRADWYSAGIILYEWLYGQRPFAAEDPAVEIAAHLEQPPDLERPMAQTAPEWARDVLERLLRKHADERGSDVIGLLTWMSQYDSNLHPDLILNEQIGDHRRSEDRRLSTAESALVDQIMQSKQESSEWIVYADRLTSESLAIGLQCGSARQNESVVVVRASGNGGADAARSGCSGDSESATRIVFHPMACAHEDRTCQQASPSSVAMALLPWDVTRVEEYVARLLGDASFAQRWSASVREVTGGLPSAVSGLFAHLFHNGHLCRHDGKWETTETALTDWQRLPGAAATFGEAVGELTSDERRLIDWFALGRSLMHLDVLRELSPMSDERFGIAFKGLAHRGLIIPTARDGQPRFADWRIRLHGLGDMWRMHMPAQGSRRQALQLASLLESCSIENDLQVFEVLAECFADAETWDKCVHYAVSVVAQHLRENRQDAARPFVLLAEAAAERLPCGKTGSYWLGRAQMARGDYQKACGLIDEAQRTYRGLLALSRRSGDRRLLAETLRDLGDLYRMTRRFEKGVRVLRRARQLWEAVGDRSEVARTLNNLGNMYWVASDRSEARRYYTEALEIAKDLGEDRTVAMILSNLGVAYKCDYDFKRAESYYRDSLAIKERLGLPGEIALTLNNLGVIAIDQGRLQEADRHFRRAIELNEGIGAEAEAVFARGNLMQVTLERGDLRAMISQGDAALSDAEALGDISTAAELRTFMAETYLRAGDFRMAGSYLDRARIEATEQKNYDLEGHLGLVEATRCLRLGFGNKANNVLDRIETAIAHAEMPRLRLDAVMIRLRSAVAKCDEKTADNLWREGLGMARAFSAPHKLAQLSLARLPADPARNYPCQARDEVEDFLSRSDERWHWIGAYRLWCAIALAEAGDRVNAERAASEAIRCLREDGNWETLWKALVVYGRIYYQHSDYGPALTALNEADHILSEILKTIDFEPERRSYSAHQHAYDLREMRHRILQLVS